MPICVSVYVLHLGVTCVLSLTTLILDIRSHIPAVPYFTAMDYFFIICYLFLLASLIQFTAVHRYLEVKIN
jgi:gamma-aminobutyric acid receptor subunit alpha